MTLRVGITTGSCATAAAKAATIGLLGKHIPDEVEIHTPVGKKIILKIVCRDLAENFAQCAVQKDAGDDPDVTNGCMVYARAEHVKNNRIEIDGGDGIGRITKPGLQVPVGQAAINPVPRSMIEKEVRQITGDSTGVRIVISVPNGKALAEKTFNPRLGIIGGISIIGTTGFVRPMSEDAFKTSLVCGLDIAKATGFETIVLVPGSLGERSITKLTDISADQIVQMSNFVGFMLNAAKERHIKKIVLAGHPGKLVKILRGDFYTHSSASQPANDIILNILMEKHVPDSILKRTREALTVEGIVEILKKHKRLFIMDEIARKIEVKVLEFIHDCFDVGVILFDMSGTLIGSSYTARIWLKNLKIKSLS